MNNTIQENEVLFDNEMLSRLDLIDYDIERTFYRVCMFMKKYRKLKVKNYCEVPIKITSTYKYVFVDEKTKGINDYTKLDAFIDNDTEYQKLSKKICSITKNFSQEELVYYTICLYRQESETRAFKEIGCSNKGLVPIKNSCIVKFACALDIEVYNDDDGFADPNEEEKFEKFMKEFKL